MKKRTKKISWKLCILFLISSVAILPIAPSVCYAQDAGAGAASSATEEAASVPGAGAAGAAGTGGASSIGTLATIGIVAASLGVILILVSALDSTSTTPSH